MYFYTWHKVKDRLEDSDDFMWLIDTMGEMGPERWVYIPTDRTYYFKHARDATLFLIKWSSSDLTKT